MSLKKMDLIWQPDKVLPYLFGELKQKIEAISPIEAMYLYGSRSRVPVEEWDELEGKDWDIIIVCRFAIVNTQIWTKGSGYYIDLKISNAKKAEEFIRFNKDAIMLYPENNLNL